MRPQEHCDEIRASFARHRRALRGPATLLLLAAVSPWWGSPPAAASEPVRLHGVAYLGDLPTFIAAERGLFAQHGLSVEVEQTPSGKQNLAILRAGEIDFALMAPTPLVLDRLAHPGPEQPDDPVILASTVHSTHLNHVVTLTDGDIREPADLAGRRLGVMRGTNAEYMWWLFAAYHRLGPGDTELVDLPVEALPDALVEGTVDAAVLWEPHVSRLHQRLGGGLQELEGSHIYSAKWLLVTTRRNAREHADRCRAMLAAYSDAIEYIERHPREALQIYADHTGIALEELQRHGEDVLYGLSLDWSLVAALQQQIEWAVRTSQVDMGEEPALLSWIEPGPLRSLSTTAVGIPKSGREEERR